MRQLVIIAHDIRSTHNIGSLLRTAEGLGIAKVYITGYSPYPRQQADQRLPHIADKLTRQIHKTALGAETNTNLWEYHNDVSKLLQNLKDKDFSVVALEQTPDSMPLPNYHPKDKIALVLGREVEGLDTELITLCDHVLEIPMFGRKESFNVIEAASMALYHCRFYPF